MQNNEYTAREMLEIKGSYYYFLFATIIGVIGIIFQLSARIHSSNPVVSMVFSAGMSLVGYMIYSRKKRKLGVESLKWIAAFLSITATMGTRFIYARNMDWTYAAQSYQVICLSVTFLVIMQFFYNKRLYVISTAVVFCVWAAFLCLAYYNGVTFHFSGYNEQGGIVHDGIQVHRELYFFILMAVIAVSSYRNIPVIEDYDRTNQQQKDVILRQADAQKALSRGIKDEIGGLVGEVEKQNVGISDFNMKMQSQASTFEEVSATMEELLGTSENISVMASRQLDENQRIETAIGAFNEIKSDTKKNLNESFDYINSVVKKTTVGNEKLSMVENTMAQIKDQSRMIAETISIIVDIADRINLLSLNASIEAARAGEYGRGFAVVANEIGKLAVQTSDSIKEIERVLSLNTRTTEEGVDVIRAAAVIIKEMIVNIDTGAEKITLLKVNINDEESHIGNILSQLGLNMKLSRDIGGATGEQKLAIESITRAVDNANSDMLSMVKLINSIAEASQYINSKAVNLSGKAESSVVGV
jgi:methyl-accepting chemotaxis protein